MYKCRDCNKKCEKPKRMNADSYYGVSTMFESSSCEEYDVCPYCEGTIEETTECEECGGHFFKEELEDDRCEKCNIEIQKGGLFSEIN